MNIFLKKYEMLCIQFKLWAIPTLKYASSDKGFVKYLFVNYYIRWCYNYMYIRIIIVIANY